MIRVFSSIVALLVSIYLMMLGHGLQSTIVPLVGQEASFSSLSIGLIGSSYFLGMIAGFLLSPIAILRAGHIRAAAAIISCGSAIAILHPLIVEPVFWAFLRFVTGFCLAGFYLIVESWLNEQATNENRGVTMSAYIIVNYLALTMGQMMAAINVTNMFVLFIFASIFVSFSIVPITLTKAAQPAPLTLVRFDLVKLYKTSPAAIITTFFLGILLGGQWVMATIYATDSGFSKEVATFFVSAIIVGGAVVQWPVGRLSDNMDRRKLLLWLMVACSVMSLVFVLLEPGTLFWLILVGIVFGALSKPAYSLAIAHGHDHAETGHYVEMAAGLLVVYSVGATIGPIIVAAMMDFSGTRAYFLFSLLFSVIISIYLILRMRVRAPVNDAAKEDFSYGTAASIVGGLVALETPDENDPHYAMPEPFWEMDNEDEAGVEEGEFPKEREIQK